MLSGILFHAAVSFTAALLAYFLNLPVLTLQGLFTYIHPDSLPAADGTKAILRRPGAIASDPKRRSRSKDSRLAFDESKAQLFRLRLSDSLLPSRLFFPSYRSSFLSSFVSLSNIAICILFPLSDPFAAAIPFASVLISASHLLFSLLVLSLERSASRFSERRLSLLSALISFFSTFVVLIHLSPSVFDFRISGAASPAAACLAGFVGGVLFTPAARAARSFWLGTDQLRWNLAVVSCGTVGRVLLYTSVILSFFSPLLWVKPLALAERFEDWRVWALAAAAGSQLLALRSNVQMYLNEPVLCWYQRLHSSRVPDMDYGRAKKMFEFKHFRGPHGIGIGLNLFRLHLTYVHSCTFMEWRSLLFGQEVGESVGLAPRDAIAPCNCSMGLDSAGCFHFCIVFLSIGSEFALNYCIFCQPLI